MCNFRSYTERASDVSWTHSTHVQAASFRECLLLERTLEAITY